MEDQLKHVLIKATGFEELDEEIGAFLKKNPTIEVTSSSTMFVPAMGGMSLDKYVHIIYYRSPQ